MRDVSVDIFQGRAGAAISVEPASPSVWPSRLERRRRRLEPPFSAWEMRPGGCWSARVGGEPQRPSEVSIGVQARACGGQGRGEVGSAPDHRLDADRSVRPASGPTRRFRHSSSEQAPGCCGDSHRSRRASPPSMTIASEQPGSSAQTAEPSSGPRRSSPDGQGCSGSSTSRTVIHSTPGATRLALSLTSIRACTAWRNQ